MQSNDDFINILTVYKCAPSVVQAIKLLSDFGNKKVYSTFLPGTLSNAANYS